VAGQLDVAFDGPDGRILVTDSLTYCDERLTPLDVVVGGSFIGSYPVAVALRAGARAVIGSAAAVGLDSAGISGLPVGDRFDAPCAAVSVESARLADGQDTYRSGIISHVNRAAAALGIQPGMCCRDAATQMLLGPPGEPGRAAELVDVERALVYDGPEGRVYAMASVGLATPECAGAVICAGSHSASVTYRYVSGYGFRPAGVICSDGGVGKERSGIAGLEPLAEVGAPAAAVAVSSARIGEGRSTHADGRISHLNRLAEAAGVRVGMSARDAALAMLQYHRSR
jgi:uncharacterized protein YunC (DUF1805 family)